MKVVHFHTSSAEQGVSDRARLIALCTGALGLFINFFVCGVYILSGESNALVLSEVAVYALILAVITTCAFRRYRIKQTFTAGLLAIFVVFWVGTLIEGITEQTAPFDFPLVLFVPLFLVIILHHRVLFATAPIQAACVYFYTCEFAILDIGPNWLPSDQNAYALMMSAFSGFSFCALGIVAFARERADAKMIEVIAEKETLASTDGLTGLLNRRAFSISIDEELRRMSRTGDAAAIIFFDLDHFKHLNDQFGLHVGDSVLTKIASIAYSELRNPFDRLARWGGEEFIILLHDMTEENAKSVCERLRVRIESLKVEDKQQDVSFTASFGGSLLHPNQPFDDALNRADAALYDAKANGRNRVEFKRHLAVAS